MLKSSLFSLALLLMVMNGAAEYVEYGPNGNLNPVDEFFFICWQSSIASVDGLEGKVVLSLSVTCKDGTKHGPRGETYGRRYSIQATTPWNSLTTYSDDWGIVSMQLGAQGGEAAAKVGGSGGEKDNLLVCDNGLFIGGLTGSAGFTYSGDYGITALGIVCVDNDWATANKEEVMGAIRGRMRAGGNHESKLRVNKFLVVDGKVQ